MSCIIRIFAWKLQIERDLMGHRAKTTQLIVKNQTLQVQISIEARSNSRVSIGKQGISIRISRYLSAGEKELQIEKYLLTHSRYEVLPLFADKPHSFLISPNETFIKYQL